MHSLAIPTMKYVFQFLSSKYLITITAFVVWMAFFDTRDVFSQLSHRRELQQLNTKIEYYHEQIEGAKNELKDLKNSPAAMEKYAREKYFMKKDNEDVFIEQ